MPRGLASLVGCLGHSAALASGENTQGVGFIGGEGGELIFHHSSLEGTAIEVLRIRQAITYEERRGPKGPRATKIRRQ
jgi:CspA family cold shock protein